MKKTVKTIKDKVKLELTYEQRMEKALAEINKTLKKWDVTLNSTIQIVDTKYEKKENINNN